MQDVRQVPAAEAELAPWGMIMPDVARLSVCMTAANIMAKVANEALTKLEGADTEICASVPLHRALMEARKHNCNLLKDMPASSSTAQAPDYDALCAHELRRLRACADLFMMAVAEGSRKPCEGC